MWRRDDVKSQRLNNIVTWPSIQPMYRNTCCYSIFIYPTGWIRVCKIRFVSTGEYRGKPCLVCKKIKSRLLLSSSGCGRTSYLLFSSFMPWELDPYSRTRKKDPSPWADELLETSEHFLQRPCNEWGGSRQSPKSNWSAFWHTNRGEKAEAEVL